MIGHLLLQLTETQEDRVLTRGMSPLFAEDGGQMMGPCLLQTMGGVGLLGQPWEETHRYLGVWMDPYGNNTMERNCGDRFDALCHRFGIARVTGAIRNRIWSNRARRTLSAQPAVTTQRAVQLVEEAY